MIAPEHCSRIQEFVNDLHEHIEVPGISVALSVAGDRFAACAGLANTITGAPLTPGSRFEPGGLTKFLVALAAHQLACRGALELAAPISRYLPELAGKNADQIQLQHLLSHSAGYRGENLQDSEEFTETAWDDFAAQFNSRALLFPPGSVYDCSQSASVVVGKVIERIAGKSARALIQEEILDPLGIAPQIEADSAAGTAASGHMFDVKRRRFSPIPKLTLPCFWNDSLLGPVLSPTDLVRLVEALIEGKPPCDPRIAASLMQSIVALPRLYGGDRREEMPVAFGPGWGHYAGETYGARSTMPGEVCGVRVHPKQRIIVAVSVNAHQPFARDYLTRKLMNAFLPTDLSEQVANDVGMGFDLEDLTGTFIGRVHTSLHIRRKEDRLLLQAGHNPAIQQSVYQQPIVLALGRDGRLRPRGDLQSVSLGFFRAPEGGALCFMIGDHAYKKVSNN